MTCAELLALAGSIIGSTSRFLVGLAPIAAVIWAVFAFHRTRKDDRDDALRLERQKICRDYLLALDAAAKSRDVDNYPDYGMKVIGAILPFHNQLTLTAPDEVVTASLKLINAHIGDHLWQGKTKIPMMAAAKPLSPQEIARELAVNETMRDARRDLIMAMRRDLVKGTTISAVMTSVEELKK